MKITRHKGSILNIGTRCAIVFRELPNEPNKCLIVETDSLPEVFKDAVLNTINNEGQSSMDLFEVLNRSYMPTGENMLNALHRNNLLKPKNTSDILVHSTAEQSVRLDELNDQLKILKDETVVKATDIQKKYNPDDLDISLLGEESLVAQRIISSIKDHMEEAQKLLHRLVSIDPFAANSISTNLVPVDLKPDDIIKILSNDDKKALYNKLKSDFVPKSGQLSSFDLKDRTLKIVLDEVKTEWAKVNTKEKK